MLKRLNIREILIICFLIFGILSCASTDNQELKSAEGIFNKAMALFNDEEYLEAKTTFDLIRLQYPASQYADDAQYYIAECHYRREEYIMSNYNFNMLRRYHPNSPFIKESFFKACMSNYYSAPQFDLDPKYTLDAIKSMSEFQAAYSSDSLAIVMDTYIQELRDRLAEREYETARLYKKLRSPASALIYYDVIINEYDDTKFFELAYLGKIEVLLEMKNWKQAKTTIEYFNILFKTSANLSKVKELANKIPQEN